MKECLACGACFGDDVAACDADGSPLEERFAGPPLVDGTYRLVKRIGHGATGVVYEAEHTHLGRRVALKILKADVDRPDRCVRFSREARALAALRHPNVVDVFDSGFDAEGRPYIVMELLHGRTLREELALRGSIPIAEALPWLESIGRGLDAAHEAGVLHRDLKPENVFLVDGSGAGVKLIDFGLARQFGEGDVARGEEHGSPLEETLTEDGVTVGTRAYLAPELATNALSSRASDLYALGVITFETLVGRRPFAGSGDALLEEHVRAAPPRPSSLLPSLPAPLDGPILAVLAKDPLERPRSAGAFVAGVRAALERGERLGALDPRARRRLANRRARMAFLAAVLVGAALATVSSTRPVVDLEDRFADWRFAASPPRPPDPRILVVLIDEPSLAADPTPLADQGDVFGSRIGSMLDAGAARVAVDLLLPESLSRSERFSQLLLTRHDRLTLAALSDAGRVIGPECVSRLVSAALGGIDVAGLFGFVNVRPGGGGVVRSAPYSFPDLSGESRPSFAFHATRGWRAPVRADAPPLLVDYRTRPSAFPRLSWKDVPDVLAHDPNRFRGHLVIVGGSFAGSGDESFHAPTGERLSGVLLQATIADGMLRKPIRGTPVAACFAMTALLGGVLVHRLLRRSTSSALLFAALAPALAFRASIASGFLLPAATVALASVASIALGLLLSAVERRAR